MADPVPVADHISLEQAHVARQDHPHITRSRIREVRILHHHHCVKARETKQRGELAEVHIQGEAYRVWSIGARTPQTGEID